MGQLVSVIKLGKRGAFRLGFKKKNKELSVSSSKHKKSFLSICGPARRSCSVTRDSVFTVRLGTSNLDPSRFHNNVQRTPREL